MLHLKQIVTGMAQGLLRAGHIVLLVIGVATAGQIFAVISVPRQSGEIDAMGGAVALPAAQVGDAGLATRQFAQLLLQLGERLTTLAATVEGITMSNHAPVVADVPVPVPRDISRLGDYLGKRYRVSELVLHDLLQTAQSVGRELRVDPLLIVSVMAIESTFNPLSESRFGAQGLMQIIPKYHMGKLDNDAGKLALFEPATNIRVGAQVLKEAITRGGSVESGLQLYAGATEDSEARYARKVIGLRDQLADIARR